MVERTSIYDSVIYFRKSYEYGTKEYRKFAVMKEINRFLSTAEQLFLAGYLFEAWKYFKVLNLDSISLEPRYKKLFTLCNLFIEDFWNIKNNLIIEKFSFGTTTLVYLQVLLHYKETQYIPELLKKVEKNNDVPQTALKLFKIELDLLKKTYSTENILILQEIIKSETENETERLNKAKAYYLLFLINNNSDELISINNNLERVILEKIKNKGMETNYIALIKFPFNRYIEEDLEYFYKQFYKVLDGYALSLNVDDSNIPQEKEFIEFKKRQGLYQKANSMIFKNHIEKSSWPDVFLSALKISDFKSIEHHKVREKITRNIDFINQSLQVECYYLPALAARFSYNLLSESCLHLMRLNEFLDIEDNIDVLFKYFKKNKLKLFLSHSSNDLDILNRIENNFNRMGIETIVDRNIIRDNDEIPKELAALIEQASHTVVLVTESSVEKDWVIQEIIHSIIQPNQLASNRIRLMFCTYFDKKQLIDKLLGKIESHAKQLNEMYQNRLVGVNLTEIKKRRDALKSSNYEDIFSINKIHFADFATQETIEKNLPVFIDGLIEGINL